MSVCNIDNPHLVSTLTTGTLLSWFRIAFDISICVSFISVIFSLNFLLGVKIIHLIDRTDFLKISNVVLGGKAIVSSLYSSLDGQREKERERDRERQQ